MKAALLTHRFASGQPTGIGRYARSLVTALADDGALDVVAASPREPTVPDWMPPNVEYRPIPGSRRLTQAALRAGLPLPLDRWLGEPDVMHALNPFVPLPRDAASVVTIHDILPVSHPQWFGRVHRTTFARIMRGLSRNRAEVICDSRYVADQLVDRMDGRLDPARVTVVHCGLDDRFRSPAPTEQVEEVCARYGLEKGRYLLALGVMSARESPDVIVEALRAVPLDMLGTPALVLTGPKRYGAERVMAAVERGGLGGRVLLAGFVPDEDLVPIIAGALALTHPSRDEGFGFTVLEAMAVGTPVIASRAGSLPEVVGDGGLLVPPDDAGAWAEAITRVASDPTARQQLVTAGSKRQGDFSWDHTARQTADVYRKAVVT